MLKKTTLLFFVLLAVPFLVLGQGPPHDMDVGPSNRDTRGERPQFPEEVPDREDVDIENEEGERRIINFTERPQDSHFDDLRAEGVAVGRSFRVVNSAVANIPEYAMEKIQGKPFVDSIEEDHEVEIVLDESVEQIEADELHERGYFGAGTSVAVMDTGIDDHEYLDITYHENFTDEGPGDSHGHGTHVAGVVGLNHSQYKGVSEGVELYDLKVLNEEGVGNSSDIMEALDHAIDNDVDVVNMSFGAEVDECDGTDVLSRAIDNAMQYGTISVVSAGNSGPEERSINLPGCAENAVTIGSVDSQSSLSDFSSRGPTADDRTKPDLVAPGESIVSSSLNDNFRTLSGTSMSAPHVTGAISLLMEAGARNDQAVEVLKETAHDIGRENNEQGEGEVRVGEAFQELEILEDPEEEPEEEERVGPPAERGREWAKERRQRAQEARERAVTRKEEKREGLEGAMEGVNEEQKERVMNLADRLDNINERVTDAYLNRLEAWENVLERLQNIAERREDVSREDFEQLEEKIDEAWDLIEEQAEKDYYIEIDSPEELREEFLRQKERLQEDHQELRENVMRNPVQVLRSILNEF